MKQIRTVRKSFSLLTPRFRVAIVLIVLMRTMVLGLDLVWLVFLGQLIAGATSRGSTGTSSSALPFGFSGTTGSLDLQSALVIGGGLLIARVLLAVAISFWTIKVLTRIDIFFAGQLFDSVVSGDVSKFRLMSQGEVVWAFGLSTHTAFASVLYLGVILISEAMVAISVIIFIVWFDPIAGVVSLVSLATLGWCFALVTSPRLQRYGQAVAHSSAVITDLTRDFFASYREMISSGGLGRFQKAFLRPRTEFADSKMKQAFILGLPRFFAEFALILGILLFLAVQAFQDPSSEGFVSSTIVFLMAFFRLTASILPLWQAFSGLAGVVPLASSAFAILDSSTNLLPEIREAVFDKDERATGLGNNGAYIDVQSVSFSHFGGSQPTLSDLSFQVPRGSSLAIVGTSGSGKSTIADLLAGITVPDSGRVLVDGLDAHVAVRERRELVGYVPQTVGMITGSIRDNLVFGRDSSEVMDSNLWRALSECGLDDLVSSLPEQLDEPLGKHVDGLSGGQLQRLGLARAILMRPKLLLFDEPTSHLDEVTEQKITETLLKLKGLVTVVVVTHSKALAAIGDSILDMDSLRLNFN